MFILNFRINWTVIFHSTEVFLFKNFLENYFWNHAQEKKNRPVFVNMNVVFQSSHRSVSIKKVLLKILQYSQENIYVGISF